MSQWWIRDRGRVMGPYDPSTLLEMRSANQVQGHMECSSDRRDWRPLDDEPSLVPPPEPRTRRPRRPTAAPEPGPTAPYPHAPYPQPATAQRVRLGTFGVVVAVLVGFLGIGCAVLIAVLVFRTAADDAGGVTPGVISLVGKSESEKTELFERAVCFVVPGHIVTTAKGEELEGVLLAAENDDGDIVLGGGTGSGFVISPDGHILTNLHVVQGVQRYKNSRARRVYQSATQSVSDPHIWVFFGADDKHTAALEYVSPDYDFAILKIDSARQNYFALCDQEPATMPILNDLKSVGFPGVDSKPITTKEQVDAFMRLKQGEKSSELFPAVERSFGGEKFKVSSRSGNMVRRAERKTMEFGQKESDVLRHSAQIYHGNSGGPLICKDGTVIGINTWFDTAEPTIGFALMMTQLRSAIDARVSGVVWRPHPE